MKLHYSNLLIFKFPYILDSNLGEVDLFTRKDLYVDRCAIPQDN